MISFKALKINGIPIFALYTEEDIKEKANQHIILLG